MIFSADNEHEKNNHNYDSILMGVGFPNNRQMSHGSKEKSRAAGGRQHKANRDIRKGAEAYC